MTRPTTDGHTRIDRVWIPAPQVAGPPACRPLRSGHAVGRDSPPRSPTRHPALPLPRSWRCPLPSGAMALAADHERGNELYPGWREVLVARLAPRPGQVVLDVGCGGGANFAALRARVGPSGMIIAVEESAELLDVAARQLAHRGWTNIELINAVVGAAPISVLADAALFCGAHEVLQSRSALANIVAHLRPGAPVVASGWKRPPAWLWPLRGYVTARQKGHVRDFTGFDRPWAVLGEHLTELRLTHLGPAGYLAYGRTTLASARAHNSAARSA